VRDQILGGDILTLTATFSRVMHVPTGDGVSSAPTIEQSFMIFRCGRDRGCGREFRGCGSFGGDVAHMVVRWP